MKIIKNLFIATRPWSFTMTIISVTLGTILAWGFVEFHLFYYLLALAGAVLVHAASNVLNDYFDTKYGIDTIEDLGAQYRQHPILTGIFTSRQFLVFSVVLFACAAGIGIAFIFLRGLPVLFFMAAGGAGGVFYTAGPVRYKYRALGEVCVLLLWGPLLVSAGYYVQNNSFAAIMPVLWISLLQGVWVLLVLFIDTLKDIEFDRKKSIRTLGTLFGKKAGLIVFLAIVVLTYLGTGMEVWLGVLPAWSLITLLSLPFIGINLWQFFTKPELPQDAAPRISQVGMIYGILLVISLVVSRIGLMG